MPICSSTRRLATGTRSDDQMSTESRLEGSLQRLDQTPPLRQRIHEQLENLITTGAFPPGARLVEGELAERLGVSRGPVRETLQHLSNDGFVDLRPRQGAFVHIPTAKEVDDFFEIRGVLESESARLAALRINPEGIENLRKCLTTAHAILAAGEHASAVNRKIRVHRAITDVADNPLLAQMLSTLNKRSTWYMSPFEPNERHEKAWAEHQQILEAIIRGDATAARKAMAAHNTGARSNYLSMKAAHSG
jgi:DNA-binding GntR family transcriptional regulator